MLFTACSSEAIEDAASTIQTDDTSASETVTSDPVSDTVPEESVTTVVSDEEKVLDSDLSVEQQAYLDAINAVRASSQNCGTYGIKPAVAPLQWDSSLADAATEHSNDMAQTEVFSHMGSGTEYDLTAIFYDLNTGSSMAERASYNKYDYTALGENIAVGYADVDAVVTGWLKSDGHCENMMDANFNEMGMALVEKEGSQYTTYWTLNLGSK